MAISNKEFIKLTSLVAFAQLAVVFFFGCIAYTFLPGVAHADSSYSGWDNTTIYSHDVSPYYVSLQSVPITPASPPTGLKIAGFDADFSNSNGASAYVNVLFGTATTTINNCVTATMPTGTGHQEVVLGSQVTVPPYATYVNVHAYTDATCSTNMPNTQNGLWGSYAYGGANYLVLHFSVVNTTTRIDTVTPSNGSTVATGTPITIGSTGYLNTADTSSNTQLQIDVCNNTYQALNSQASVLTSAYNCQGYSTTTPLNSSGSWSVSDTNVTLTYDGKYTMTTKITKPYFSIFGFNFFTQTLVSTTTTFTASTTTTYDNFVTNMASSTRALASYAAVGLYCQPLSGSFDIGACLRALFIPTTSDIGTQLTDNAKQLLTYAPWGYVTQVYQDFNATSTAATSTLPSLSITFPAGLNLPVTGTTLNLTPWNYMLGPGSYISTHETTVDGTNIVNKFLVYWNWMWYLMFAYWLLSKFFALNIDLRHDESHKQAQIMYEETLKADERKRTNYPWGRGRR